MTKTLIVSEKKIPDLHKIKESEMVVIKFFIKGCLKFIHYHVNIMMVFMNQFGKILKPLFGSLRKSFQCFNFLTFISLISKLLHTDDLLVPKHETMRKQKKSIYGISFYFFSTRKKQTCNFKNWNQNFYGLF